MDTLLKFALVVAVTIVFVYVVLPRPEYREVIVPEELPIEEENLYARTPINKVDDYEFSRIVGYQEGNRMIVPEQNFDLILNQRQFDWPNQPLLADERADKYRDMPPGVTEGFSGLKDIVLAEPTPMEQAVEAVSRYGERRRNQRVEEVEVAESCAVSREDREVAAMVAATYNDPNFEPVVTRVGPHNWEVNELKQLRASSPEEVPHRNPYAKDAVDIRFKYRQGADVESAIDPYFPVEHSPFNERDRFYGPVPGMERMFGPTRDTEHWY